MLNKIALCLIFLTNYSLCADTEENKLFYRPIMYGTALGLALVIFMTYSTMYALDYEKDPLIYSKFLSVRKNR